jgi:D-alanine-D-alanine ligase
LTIALVYNLKKEATPLTPPSAPQGIPLAAPSPSSLRILDQDTAPSPRAQRVNDAYAEWDTMETIDAVRAALAERHSVTLVEADVEAYGRLRTLAPDFVFNIAEGLHGVSREAQIPAMLEMLGIPYLGSDPLTLALCLDKARAKEVLAHHHVPTAGFSVVTSMEELDDLRVRFPSIVKPLHEGSSKGIYNSCVVRTTDELAREIETVLGVYAQPALVEEFLPGREFTVALLGNGNDVHVLPIVEIRFDALPEGMNPIYSYEAKWIWDTTEKPLEIFDCPAKIPENLRKEIEQICAKTYRILRCRDWSRIDVRLDRSGKPHILEINPLPGILPKPEDNSCFPKAARAAGMSYNQLMNRVLDIALRRTGVAGRGNGV